MKKEEVEKLVNLRTFLIEQYQGLDGGSNPSTAVMRQQEVASIYSNVIKRLDEALSEYVNFQ
jgi:hypothetical protein